MPFEGSFEECIAEMTLKFRIYYRIWHEEELKAVQEFAALMEREMVMACPIGDTKQLVKSITHRVEIDADGNIIGMVGVPGDTPAGTYFCFVVFGTGRRGAQSAAFLGLRVPKDFHHSKYHSYNEAWPGMAANPFPYEVLARNKPLFKQMLKAAHQRAAERLSAGGDA